MVGEWGVRLRIVVVVVSHYIVVVTERELTVCTTTAAAATPKLEREQRAAGSGEGDGAHPDQPVVTTAKKQKQKNHGVDAGGHRERTGHLEAGLHYATPSRAIRAYTAVYRVIGVWQQESAATNEDKFSGPRSIAR